MSDRILIGLFGILLYVGLLGITTEYTEIPLHLRKTQKESVNRDMVSDTDYLSFSVFSVSEAVFPCFFGEILCVPWLLQKNQSQSIFLRKIFDPAIREAFQTCAVKLP